MPGFLRGSVVVVMFCTCLLLFMHQLAESFPDDNTPVVSVGPVADTASTGQRNFLLAAAGRQHIEH